MRSASTGSPAQTATTHGRMHGDGRGLRPAREAKADGPPRGRGAGRPGKRASGRLPDEGPGGGPAAIEPSEIRCRPDVATICEATKDACRYETGDNAGRRILSARWRRARRRCSLYDRPASQERVYEPSHPVRHLRVSLAQAGSEAARGPARKTGRTSVHALRIVKTGSKWILGLDVERIERESDRAS